MEQKADIDFLVACFNTARDEILFRVRHRDAWLKINLISQAALLALAVGIKFQVEGSKATPEFACLAPVASLVFACMYAVEDRLVGHLGSYIGSLSEAEGVLQGREHMLIVNWDISVQLREDYAKGPALKIRLVAQILSFIVIPGGISSLWLRTLPPGLVFLLGSLGMGLVLGLAGFVCVKGYRFRRRTGEVSKAKAAIRIVSPP
jgi:hypothetical protein